MIFITFVVTLSIQFWQRAYLERLRVGSEDEIVAARTEATCSNRLVISELSQLGHMADSRVDYWLNIADYLLQRRLVGLCIVISGCRLANQVLVAHHMVLLLWRNILMLMIVWLLRLHLLSHLV